jgi:transcriptional regulator with XRE-family HTH domain
MWYTSAFQGQQLGANVKHTKRMGTELSRLFRQERLKSGLTQDKVCRILGYSSPQFLSNFERGLCMMPLKKLKKLIEIYNMDNHEVAHLILRLQEKYILAELTPLRSTKRR